MQSFDSLEHALAALRSGAPVPRQLDFFVEAGALSAAAQRGFVDALERGPDVERENLIHALISIGRRLDPLAMPGLQLLREPAVIDILTGPGLRSGGMARDAAIEGLMAGVPPALLHVQGRALAEALTSAPDAGMLRLAAKAKAKELAPVLSQLAAATGPAPGFDLKLALAAFGDVALEQEFIRAFEQSHDARSLARAAQDLASVGTPRAMQALAQGMRSDLVDEMPQVMRRSVRVDIVAALHSMHPELPILWDSAVRSDADYARIEQFCEQTYGVRWNHPRPPFLWIEGLPGH